jgi:alpha-tubulin suppressor-like RCC1 family protein
MTESSPANVSLSDVVSTPKDFPMNHRFQAHVHVSLLVLTLLALGACSSQKKAGSADKRISATVSGLIGSGLVIQTNGGNSVTVTANGSVLLAYISSGTHYDVTVTEQPHDPVQSCAVTGGSGTMGDSDVSNISVACTGGAYDVIARVSGLIGTGLVLRDDVSGRSVSVTANGTVTLESQITDGSSYAIGVTNPTNPFQTCSVSPTGGTLAGANVLVDVTCSTRTFDITASISGLQGQGLTLQANVSGGRPVPVAANGTVTLASQVADGSPYSVEVSTPPTTPSQTCTLSPLSGTLAGANATVVVTCTINPFDVTASVQGLKGQGLVLHEKVSDRYVTVTADGTATLVHQIPDGSAYLVEVSTPPTNPLQSCTLSPLSGSGTLTGANASVVVTCTITPLDVTASVQGLKGQGLVLHEKVSDRYVTVAADGTVTLVHQIPDGSNYLVEVAAPPTNPSQTCTLSPLSGSGTLHGTSANVVLTCVTNSYTVSNYVVGYTGSGLVLVTTGLGLGTFSPPTRATSFGNPVSLLSGTSFTVRIATQPTASGLVCFVINGSHQITSSNIRVVVTCRPSAIAAGSNHTVALRGGSLWYWGYDHSTPIISIANPRPVQSSTDTDWALVSAGWLLTLGLRTDGSLWGWGTNTFGQLGDGTTVTKSSLEHIGTDSNWALVSASNEHAAALKTDGSLYTWGLDGYGEGPFNRGHPTYVGTDWASVSAGGEHTIGIKTDGSLWAWGKNSNGQLGDGTNTNRTSPVPIGTDTGWAYVSAGYNYTVALKADGSLCAWGANTYGQLGDGTTVDQTSPKCLSGNQGWAMVSAGGGHTLALKTDGSLWAWGQNDSGQLGDATNTSKPSSVRIGSAKDWSLISAGISTSVAMTASGSVWTWGDNAHSQVGDGTTTSRNSPYQVWSP